MTGAALELRNVVGRSTLGALGATFPINFGLKAGDVGVVFGGKETSSLFRLVMGSGELESGEIVLEDSMKRDRSSRPDHDVAAWRKRIGFAFREKGLLSNLTLFDNVDLPAKYHGLYRKGGVKPGALAERAMKELEVDPEIWKVRPNRISWEVRKKVLIARAIVLSPKVLILDDPSALIATPQVPFLVRWIRQEKAKGTAILIGTNDYPFGLAVADWVLHPITNDVTTKYDFIDDAWIKSAELLLSHVAKAA